MKFNIYRTELPNLGKIHIFIVDEGALARAHWGTKVDTADAPTAWDAAQTHLKKVGLKLPPNGMTTPETGVYAIEINRK